MDILSSSEVERTVPLLAQDGELAPVLLLVRSGRRSPAQAVIRPRNASCCYTVTVPGPFRGPPLARHPRANSQLVICAMNVLLFAFETESGSRRGIYQVFKSLYKGMKQINYHSVDIIFADSDFNFNKNNSLYHKNSQHYDSKYQVRTGDKTKKTTEKIVRIIVRNLAILANYLLSHFLDQSITLLVSRLPLTYRLKGMLEQNIHLVHWAFQNSRIASCIAIKLMGLPVDIEGGGSWLVTMCPTMISRQKNCRLATFVHDLIPLDYTLHDESNLSYLRKLNHCCQNSDKIICVSHTTAKRLISHDPSVKAKISVVHTSISEVQTHDMRESRPRYTLPIHLCSIGSVEPRKNWPGILRALLDTAGLPPIQFTFVGGEPSGDPSFHKKIEKLTDKLHAYSSHSIIFTGRVSAEEKCKYLQQSAAFVYVPFMEGAALPIIEAQLVGCPTLISDLPVFREFIHADSAYFADPNQPASIGAALSTLCTDLKNGKCRSPMSPHLLASLASPTRFAKEVMATLAAADR